MKKSTLIVSQLLLAFLYLSACNNTSEKEQAQTSEVKETERQTAAVIEHTDQVLEKYHELKAALVDTDPEKAQELAKNFAELTKAIHEKAASDEKAQFALAIQKDVEQLAKSDNIETQRELFVPLTDNVYKMTKAFPADTEVYYAYCPMAFNDKGAYWLEKEKTILNPYYGSKMLKCGSIKETIAKN